MHEANLSAQMKWALRRLAKAVVVITCKFEGGRFAMAATAVSELSMDPPSLLICVNRSASLFAPLTAGADFCVNILHSSHEAVSVACSGKLQGEARFGEGQWAESEGLDLPYLVDSQASFACRNTQRVEYGTHGIFIGEVVRVMSHGPVDPLIYVDGRYASVQSGETIAP
jgi:flavin reductase (DIM6/NTAB) family NADH-FMN oxidoreductase RutF